MAMRSMWKGALSFGLVAIPVHLYTATENHNVSFRQVHRADGGRIQYKRVCTIDGEEVPYSDIAKGYETPEGEMVIVTDEDLASLPLPASRGIEVVEFVPLESIDPIYWDRSYYLEPQKGGGKPYVLLRDALHKSGQVGIAQVVLRQRETLAVLRVYADVLVLTTMLWPDEVRKPDFSFLHDEAPQVRPQELTMAGSLIDSMSDEVFDASKYRDHYQEALTELIEAKIAGREVSAPVPAKNGDEPVDLMSALRASVSAAKKTRTTDGAAKAVKSTTSKDSSAGAAKTTRRTASTRKTAEPKTGTRSSTTRRTKSG